MGEDFFCGPVISTHHLTCHMSGMDLSVKEREDVRRIGDGKMLHFEQTGIHWWSDFLMQGKSDAVGKT